MSYPFPPNLARLVEERMATGLYADEDTLLCEALESLSEEEADLEAVKSALAELAAGDPGLPIDDALHAIRSA